MGANLAKGRFVYDSYFLLFTTNTGNLKSIQGFTARVMIYCSTAANSVLDYCRQQSKGIVIGF